MWKVIFILIVFNTNTGEFEKSSINILKKDKYLRMMDVLNSIVPSKNKNLKFIKIIKDSVYVPDDSCYSKVKDLTKFQYLKTN